MCTMLLCGKTTSLITGLPKTGSWAGHLGDWSNMSGTNTTPTPQSSRTRHKWSVVQEKVGSAGWSSSKFHFCSVYSWDGEWSETIPHLTNLGGYECKVGSRIRGLTFLMLVLEGRPWEERLWDWELCVLGGPWVFPCLVGFIFICSGFYNFLGFFGSAIPDHLFEVQGGTSS